MLIASCLKQVVLSPFLLRKFLSILLSSECALLESVSEAVAQSGMNAHIATLPRHCVNLKLKEVAATLYGVEACFVCQ